jgi:MSHA pilin protein MshC
MLFSYFQQTHIDRTESGFTLVELVIVIVVLGIISAYAVMRSPDVSSVTLPSQAQQLASDIRHAQTLAYTWGKSLSFIAEPSRYCVTLGASDCSGSNPITDPSTGGSFIVYLQKGVGLTGTAPLVINSLGQPTSPATGGATYTLGGSQTVTVDGQTGFVKVL